ncbi:MAG: hypothetical protein US83_C0001G0008 [Candidatus Falkowbacteria bacterium GW2011_GWC2_38_22]|uniref:Uncharacterized protein n=1 Tax=Candidatus Falkowbacteria bacterium GW2011_GWE1_38_31 TaxID=1618638 RepID=A0A0G0MAZ6_9BACT|nr:MAG: hypothetical protein US73_C0004G0120 [Candidatus Falkowbacteria bacterium GW2011_GWF2_38_1205]KKQ62074.1 MAG: hypothetical protein US83_C0001G0008 [Candidatus Falkowbacteria bacterium GW2011_GWC2_38_22]KKQ64224.1 MAG: hypothetical protein US84_C0001G0008 [Candidatus Falkowbacteria bacterium GW2011_GWF1_38_22]KKQ66201.1 MAG: hypothetical protein US87_C0002G0008 [Candidatus Falkowbacteria bacterium GW2011_GWE2_38_254]KKQ70929.1 MAG: hypothetical protein US91_C0002G0008 [Candidatus Falkowb
MEADDKKIVTGCISEAGNTIKSIDWNNQDIRDSLFANLELRIKKIESPDIFCRADRIRAEFWEEVAMILDMKIDVLKICDRSMKKQLAMLMEVN